MKIILVDAWNTFFTENGIDQNLKTLLDSYPNKKIIVTNANPDEQVEYGMKDLPYELFSLNHEPNKTDPSYFEKLMKEFNFSSDEIIYFEHNPDAVKSAESLGIISYNYDHTKRDLDGVKNFLAQNS